MIGNNRLEEVFEQLEALIDPARRAYNDLMLSKSRWKSAQRGEVIGVIAFERGNLSFNSVKQALLWLIDNLIEEDIKPGLLPLWKPSHHIAPDYVFTCDRIDQNDAFQLSYYDPPEQLLAKLDGKVRFFYVHGDVRQAHRTLVKRLSKELGGLLPNFHQGDFDPEPAPVLINCKPQVSRNPKIAQIMAIKELLRQFGVKVQPSTQRRISDLLSSQKVEHLGKENYVFILITIDDYNWDKELTPELVRTFYEDFCNCTLPDDAPQFFFFFGIEYRQENQLVQQEVALAMEQAQHGPVLPRLAPVQLSDIDEWLSRIKEVLPPGTDTLALAKSWFPDQSQIDMADVILRLQQFVNEFNAGRWPGNV